MAPHPDYPRTRLYVEPSLHAGTSVSLPKEQAHYLRDVLRLRAGERVALFNGRDGEWLAEINNVEKTSAGVDVISKLKDQRAAPAIGLLFAPLKGGKSEWIVEKATELGASWIQPVFTAHTVVTKVNRERLQKIAIEAAEQCERMEVPVMADAIGIREVGNTGMGEKDILLFCDESGKGVSLPEYLATLGSRIPAFPHSRILLLTGPEGGFSPAELEQLRAMRHAHGVTLGPRILKADTAAVCALSVVMSHLGDWNEKPAFRHRISHSPLPL